MPSLARVLIADDYPDIRDMLEYFIASNGFAVRVACDGVEAVEIAHKFCPDVVLLDLWMPRLDGIDTCLQLRAGPCPRPIAIYAITADPRRVHEVPPCFDRAFLKPFDPERLVAIIREDADTGAKH